MKNKSILVFLGLFAALTFSSCGPKQHKTVKLDNSAATIQQTCNLTMTDYHDELQLLTTPLTQEQFQEQLYIYITKKYNDEAPFYTYYNNLNHTIIKLSRITSMVKKDPSQQKYLSLLKNLRQLRKLVKQDKQYQLDKKTVRKRQRVKTAIAVPASMAGLAVLTVCGIAIGALTGLIHPCQQ